MGWLYMQSLKGHDGPRQYLDAQFTYQRPDVTSTVLRSALAGMQIYYAAIEHIHTADNKRHIWALICHVKYNPRARDGYIFGYKNIDESMGPYDCNCPEPILDLLTPTDCQYANKWRTKCRQNIAARHAKAAKPKPRPGQTIIFDKPIYFSNGQSFDSFEVVPNPRSHRTVLFREPESGDLYRIQNIKTQTYLLSEPRSS